MAPRKCYFYGCKNRNSKCFMFRFPVKDKKRLELWLEYSGNKKTMVDLKERELSNRYLCEAHFSKSDIISATNSEKKLKLTAVPIRENLNDSSPSSSLSNIEVYESTKVYDQKLKIEEAVKRELLEHADTDIHDTVNDHRTVTDVKAEDESYEYTTVNDHRSVTDVKVKAEDDSYECNSVNDHRSVTDVKVEAANDLHEEVPIQAVNDVTHTNLTDHLFKVEREGVEMEIDETSLMGNTRREGIAAECSVRCKMELDESHQPVFAGEPASKRFRELSSYSASRRLSSSDIEHFLHYGSEADTDDDADDGEDEVSPAIVRSRVSRLFVAAPGEDEIPEKAEVSPAAQIHFEWPPRLVSESASQPKSQQQPQQQPPQQPPQQLQQPAHFSEAEVIYGPSEKFHFEWRAFSQPQTPPGLRKEPFSDINCGPTASYASPYEAFTAIWDRKIMENIVVETNNYAHRLAEELLYDCSIAPNSRITNWRDTYVDELYVLFAIILSMGIIVKTCMWEYWETRSGVFQTPGFAKLMSRHRFQLLCRCLHFTSNTCNPKFMSRSEAKIYKIKPIITHLNRKFAQLYNLSQNIALDESITQWKSWLDINQIIHNKAATVGIKTYEVCESQTGYLWRFEIHAGHDHHHQTDDPVSGFIPALVLRLLNGLEHKGHTIWMDNYYNSPALARELKVRGFDCVGTLRTNSQFVPVELTNLMKSDKALGQVSGCTSGDVDLVVWKEKNRVALISTYHGLATVECGDKTKPNIIADYNVCMGGVDRKDQMLAQFFVERKRTKVWYKKLFRRLLNTSVLNAYILYKAQVAITHRKFRKTLVEELLAKHSTSPTPSVAPQGQGHFPCRIAGGADMHSRVRRLCAVCKKRTTSCCNTCNVTLCVFTCFAAYHTQQ